MLTVKIDEINLTFGKHTAEQQLITACDRGREDLGLEAEITGVPESIAASRR